MARTPALSRVTRRCSSVTPGGHGRPGCSVSKVSATRTELSRAGDLGQALGTIGIEALRDASATAKS